MARYYTAVIKPWPFPADCDGLTNPGMLNSISLPIPERGSGKLDFEEEGLGFLGRQCTIIGQLLEKETYPYGRTVKDRVHFLQLEHKGDFFHLHVVVPTSLGNPRTVRNIFKRVEEKLCLDYLQLPNTHKLFEPHMTVHGAWKSADEGFLYSYLFTKVPPEYIWSTTNNPEWMKFTNDLQCRNIQEHIEIVENDNDLMGNLPKGRKLKKLVDYLIKKEIYTTDQCRRQLQDIWYSYISTPVGKHTIQTALEEARNRALCNRPLGYILTNTNGPMQAEALTRNPCIEGNKIYQLLKLNDYDPGIVGMLFWLWSIKDLGKKNCIFLQGPPSTGKSQLAGGIARTGKNFGMVNWNNENFPLSDLAGKNCGWWDEGQITKKMVDAVKCIFAGSRCRIDMKCRPSTEIEPPPMILTSNTDMTIIRDGSLFSNEEQEALQIRMVKLELNTQLSNNWGTISEETVREYWVYAAYTYYRTMTEMPQVGEMLRNTSYDFRDMQLLLQNRVPPEVELTADEEAELLKEWFDEPPVKKGRNEEEVITIKAATPEPPTPEPPPPEWGEDFQYLDDQEF
ncbi:NS1 [Horse parvovirus CSF]|uniref:NS1 n=1 Tax=Horse parvovirus CSF TaxID=1673640 RepID=A0A8F0SSH1_9VIRU|nr:NS1 [Horse parvovirus CSF]QWL55121.1 NS1 [Horse parvovirus CSF]